MVLSQLLSGRAERGGYGVGRPTKSALESRVEWGIEEGRETSRIFCSKAKFPTNISAEKEFLRRQRINQAMMKGRREKGASYAWIFPRELFSPSILNPA